MADALATLASPARLRQLHDCLLRDLDHFSGDCCITMAPSGGEVAGRTAARWRLAVCRPRLSAGDPCSRWPAAPARPTRWVRGCSGSPCREG
jgi:hypothetical protein